MLERLIPNSSINQVLTDLRLGNSGAMRDAMTAQSDGIAMRGFGHSGFLCSWLKTLFWIRFAIRTIRRRSLAALAEEIGNPAPARRTARDVFRDKRREGMVFCWHLFSGAVITCGQLRSANRRMHDGLWT